MTCERREADVAAVGALDRRLRERLEGIEGVFLNGSEECRVQGILNLGFACVESESLMMALKDVAISSGSACTSSRVESSHVLRAMGLPDDMASCSVRFSLGRFTTEEEIDFCCAPCTRDGEVRCGYCLPNGNLSAKRAARLKFAAHAPIRMIWTTISP